MQVFDVKFCSKVLKLYYSKTPASFHLQTERYSISVLNVLNYQKKGRLSPIYTGLGFLREAIHFQKLPHL